MVVGDIAAEFDTLLHDAFLDTGDLNILKDTNSPKSVIVGRTGAGKTALISVLEMQCERVLRIHPENLSMQYLTNSTIIPYLVRNGVKLDPFFQLLWRHVLIMELVRDFFHLRDEAGQKSFLQRAGDIFASRAAKQAMEYYSQWNPSFWESSDIRVREITKALADKIQAKMGPSYARLDAEFEKSAEVKEEEVQRAQSVVKEVSLETMNVGLELVKSKVLADRQKPYYVVIDDLDKNWVDSELSYSLIENLLDVVGDFAKLPNVKIVVALRDNIVEALHHRRGRQRQQREKHESLFLRLRWSRPHLVELVEKRLTTVMRSTYGGGITLGGLLPETRGRKERSGIDFVFERTFMRPRDLIDFLNRCVQEAAAKDVSKLSWQVLLDAERGYSIGRLKSLEDEWYDTYPDIGVVFRAFDSVENPFQVTDLDDNRITDVLVAGENTEEVQSLAHVAFDLDRKHKSIREIWLALMPFLYRVSFVGVKPSPLDPVHFSYDSSSIATDQLTAESRYYIHPALHRALHIKGESDTRAAVTA